MQRALMPFVHPVRVCGHGLTVVQAFVPAPSLAAPAHGRRPCLLAGQAICLTAPGPYLMHC